MAIFEDEAGKMWEGDDNGGNLKPYTPPAPMDESADKKGNPILAGMQSFGNAATLGYLPNLQSATEGAMFKVGNLLTGQNIQPKGYVESRDAYGKRQEQLSAENPIASGVGTGLGIASSLLVPAKAAASGASLLAKTGRAAATGAGLGAVANPGNIEGEAGLQVGGRAQNAALGGILGAVGQAALTGGANAYNGVKAALPKAAARRGFKALGPYQPDVLKMRPGQLETVGNRVLDEGALDGLPGHELIGHRLSEKADEAGAALGSLINDIDGKIAEAVGKQGQQPGLITGIAGNGAPKFGVERQAVADHVFQQVQMEAGIPGAKAFNAKAKDLIAEFLEGDPMLSLKQSESLKRSVGDKINWKRKPGDDIPDDEYVRRALYTALKKGGEDAAEFAADTLGGNLKQQLVAAKNRYGELETAAHMAGVRAKREFANRMVSPSDYGSGFATAVMTGNPLISAGAAMANKGAREHGNALLAKGFRAGAKLPNAPQAKPLTIGQLGGRTGVMANEPQAVPLQGPMAGPFRLADFLSQTSPFGSK
jgi:hypothetical protein